jgi:V8-like Glu-specific endopeptidase
VTKGEGDFLRSGGTERSRRVITLLMTIRLTHKAALLLCLAPVAGCEAGADSARDDLDLELGSGPIGLEGGGQELDDGEEPGAGEPTPMIDQLVERLDPEGLPDLDLDQLTSNDPVGGCANNVCADKQMIICGDDRMQGPASQAENQYPWSAVARLSIGNGVCSGTMITDRHVLTAAHCVKDSNGWKSGSYGVSVAQSSACDRPYGVHYAKRAWVPKQYDPSSNSPESKSFDYAVLELAVPVTGVDTLEPRYYSHASLTNSQWSFNVGYPGTVRAVYTVAGFHPWESEAWLNGGESGILRTTNDVSGGQSGGPLFIWRNNRFRLVGVMVGSPEDECLEDKVWSSRMTPTAISRIDDVVEGNFGAINDWYWRNLWGKYLPADVLPSDNCGVGF